MCECAGPTLLNKDFHKVFRCRSTFSCVFTDFHHICFTGERECLVFHEYFIFLSDVMKTKDLYGGEN